VVQHLGNLLTDKSHEWRLHALGHVHLAGAEGLGKHFLRPLEHGDDVARDGVEATQSLVKGQGRRGGGQVVAHVQSALKR
jgi:hypothetical protein